MKKTYLRLPQALKDRPFPFYVLGFAVFPIFALLSNNIQEVNLQTAFRSMIISLLAVTALLVVLRLLKIDHLKTGIVIAFLLILFFSYGHVYAELETISVSGIQLGRHRYLILIYAASLIFGIWWIIKRIKNPLPMIKTLNIIAITLVVLPCLQMVWYFWNSSLQEKQTAQLMASSDIVLSKHPDLLPDIYYIILDSYTRRDALLADINFDNTPFLNKLSDLGFTMAECGRSNYGYTQGSIAAALNMDYLVRLGETLEITNPGEKIWILIKQNKVRQMLEGVGYTTVAFDTGYEWSRITDADIYLSLGSDSALMQMINPFEAMLIKSTAGLILSDSQNRFLRAGFQDVNFPYSFHVNNTRFILDQLPKLAENPDPTFVFVHLLVPHVPYVFDEDGNVNEDPGYYSGEKAGPINDFYKVNGYINQIRFINQAMLDILTTITNESVIPPIIIINGDHGMEGDNRYQILNAYYLPEGIDQKIYPSITPVNSFRVVFDSYFGTHFGLLADISISGDGQIMPETSSFCVEK